MASWQLSSEGKQQVKSALAKSIYDGQVGLAKAVPLAYSTVNIFFNGQKINCANFKKLAVLLNLNPDEIREHPADLPNLASTVPYVARINEKLWYEKILEPQILIRIQAPAQFGKTALMCRILDRAKQQGHLTIFINLTEIDDTVNLANPQIFLQQFIRQIESEIDESYIDALMSDEKYEGLVSRFGATKAFLKYLEHLQGNIPQPFTLGINKLDRLLQYPDTARTFFPLLRLMNEKSVHGGRWENFRVVLAHSTPAIETFVGMSEHQSPFNIGYSIELPEFTPSQVADLASQRKLSLQPTEIEQLMQSIGGIPYLVKLILDQIQQDGFSSLALDLLYRQHLQGLAGWLKTNNLRSAMDLVVNEPEDTGSLSFKEQCFLHRQGLVVFANNGVKARCELYRQYFMS
jgi:AAA-like domain